MVEKFPLLSDIAVLASRSPKDRVDPYVPIRFFAEPERTAHGFVEDVATIFLANRECPFRCLMCDLWKQTLDHRVPTGAIPTQIDYALARLPPCKHIKLYNSGNFFDRQAIPREDFQAIAERLSGFRTVIVENHPAFCNEDCLFFRDLLPPGTDLEIAIGLETIHPDVLPRLNKRMTLDDFLRAAAFLRGGGIHLRAFLLLSPPYMPPKDDILWAQRSIDFAFEHGVRCCSVIPTRGGNSVMDELQSSGAFKTSDIRALELVLETALRVPRGRVFADLWDWERFNSCVICGPARWQRLVQMNLTQTIPPSVKCDCGNRELVEP